MNGPTDFSSVSRLASQELIQVATILPPAFAIVTVPSSFILCYTFLHNLYITIQMGLSHHLFLQQRYSFDLYPLYTESSVIYTAQRVQ
jgi:hypothetical protein